jgi:voltage-gated potassium channel
MSVSRKFVFSALNFEGPLGRVIGTVLLFCIGVSIATVVLESVEWIDRSYGAMLETINNAVVVVFLAEYALRLWTCVELPQYRHPVIGRLRYVFTPMMIIDLLAIAPVFLIGFGMDLRSLRMFRTVRLFRVFKVTRYVRALETIRHVLRDKREQLAMTIGIVLFLLLITSSLMYELEHDAQPQAFSSIPATMWWAVASLTTVGYGDLYPITPLGKLLAAISAVLGVGLVALPAGILASGFSSDTHDHHAVRCPHCGKGTNL